MVLNQRQVLGHLEPKYDNDRSRKTFEIRLPLTKNQVTEQVAGEVTGEVQKFLKILHTPMSRSEAQIVLNLKGQANFRERYLNPALDLELVEMTIPDKPRSNEQKYRLTDKGKKWVEQNQTGK